MLPFQLQISLEGLLARLVKQQDLQDVTLMDECVIAREPRALDESAPQDMQEPACCLGVACALQTVTAWASSLGTSSETTSHTSVPHQHLLMLVDALCRTHNDDTPPSSTLKADNSLLSSSCKTLAEAVVQAAAAAEASAAALASMQRAACSRAPVQAAATAAAAAAALPVINQSSGLQAQQLGPSELEGSPTAEAQGGAHDSPQQLCQHTAPGAEAQQTLAAMSDATEHFQAVLFWSCHLTTALHKVRSHHTTCVDNSQQPGLIT